MNGNGHNPGAWGYAVEGSPSTMLQVALRAVSRNGNSPQTLPECNGEPCGWVRQVAECLRSGRCQTAVLAGHAGVKVPADTELLFGETDEKHPFVDHEQMMPFVPFVRVPDVDTAIALAKKYEHGFGHTAVIHSRNVDTITRMGRELDTTLFIANGASVAGLGIGGEGFLSFSIATPTGEGVTTPLTFTRQRRSTTVRGMRVL